MTRKHILFLILLGISALALGFFARATVEVVREPGEVVVRSPQKNVVAVDPIKPNLFEYIEIVDSCGPYYDGECVNVRSGPGEEYPSILKARTGMVLRVRDEVQVQGRTWYKIIFDEELRYPERVQGDLYVVGEYVRPFLEDRARDFPPGQGIGTRKRIVVERSQQMLYAYEGDELFMQLPISTGLEFTPTPIGSFSIYRKSPSRYMQGPLPGVSDQYYDLPGVPWNLYFTYQGGVIHGAYWHDKFGQRWSHGCVNLPVSQAEKLYAWADLGVPVIVKE